MLRRTIASALPLGVTVYEPDIELIKAQPMFLRPPPAPDRWGSQWILDYDALPTLLTVRWTADWFGPSIVARLKPTGLGESPVVFTVHSNCRRNRHRLIPNSPIPRPISHRTDESMF